MNWVNRLKKVHMLSIITIFLIIIACLIAVIINNGKKAKQASENSYNMAFYDLVRQIWHKAIFHNYQFRVKNWKIHKNF